jgi:hypothetical protein
MEWDPRLRMNLISSADPEAVTGSAFVEAHIGVNRSSVEDRGFQPGSR